MADPRLNSIHLEPVRRNDFRKAREGLLNARGEQTLMAEEGQEDPASLTSVYHVRSRIPAGMDYVLMDKDLVYKLKVGLNTVGRLPDNDVVIPDPFVSRRHCAILVHTTDTCELHDVASKNGTYVNGRPLAGPTSLVSGDEIRMCDRQFIFIRRTDLENPPSNDKTQST